MPTTDPTTFDTIGGFDVEPAPAKPARKPRAKRPEPAQACLGTEPRPTAPAPKVQKGKTSKIADAKSPSAKTRPAKSPPAKRPAAADLTALWRRLDDVDRWLLQDAAAVDESAWVTTSNPDAWADIRARGLVVRVSTSSKPAHACTPEGRRLVAHAHRERLPDTADYRRT